jgi:chromosome segregation ATPase
MTLPLQRELEKTKFQLAELIDEVVYAEKEKSSAEESLQKSRDEISALHACIENLLGYASTLESNVVIPSLKTLTNALNESELQIRSKALQELESRAATLPPRTSKLIASLKQPPANVAARLEARRDAILRVAKPIDLEEAYVLTALLLDAKEELSVLLSDTAGRLRIHNLTSSSSPGSTPSIARLVAQMNGVSAPSPPRETYSQLSNNNNNSSSTANALLIQELQARVLELELELSSARSDLISTKSTLQAVQNDRGVLLERVGEHAPFQRLQEKYHAERNSLQDKLRTAQLELRSKGEEIMMLSETLDITKRALEHAEEDRNRLDEEVSRLRVSFPSTSLAAGSERSHSGRHSASATALHFWEDQAHQLQLRLDAAQREHGAEVNRLESQLSEARLELAANRTAGLQRNGAHSEQLLQMQQANELLRNELAALQSKFLSSVSVQHDNYEESMALDNKILAFESTIDALHAELQLVESRVAQADERHAMERRQIVSQFDEERQRYQQEREACDDIVLQMTREMETIVRENNILRAAISRSDD